MKPRIIRLSQQQVERKLAPWCTNMSAEDLRGLGYEVPLDIPDRTLILPRPGLPDGATHSFIDPVDPYHCLAA